MNQAVNQYALLAHRSGGDRQRRQQRQPPTNSRFDSGRHDSHQGRPPTSIGVAAFFQITEQIVSVGAASLQRSLFPAAERRRRVAWGASPRDPTRAACSSPGGAMSTLHVRATCERNACGNIAPLGLCGGGDRIPGARAPGYMTPPLPGRVDRNCNRDAVAHAQEAKDWRRLQLRRSATMMPDRVRGLTRGRLSSARFPGEPIHGREDQRNLYAAHGAVG